MMKRMMALVLALAMLMSASALAADSSKYTLSLIDPMLSVSDGQGTVETLDMTGLELALSALLADDGTLGVVAELFSGENSDYLTGLLLQLDESGAAFKLDGMASCYDIPVEDGGDVMLYTMLSILGLRQLLNSFDMSQLEMSGMELSFGPETRIALLEAALGSFVTESNTVDGKSVHKFAISRDQGRELIGAGIDAAEDVVDADLGSISFELTGVMTAEGDPAAGSAKWTVVGNGMLYEDEMNESVPLMLNYSDDMRNVDLSVVAGPEGETISLLMNSVAVAAADGRDAFETDIALKSGETDVLTADFDVTPAEGKQVDYSLTLVSDEESEDAYLSIGWSTDYTPNFPGGEGFRMEVSTTDDGEEVRVGFSYEGQPYQDPEFGTYRVGAFTLDAKADGTEVSFGTTVLLMRQDVDSGDWSFDASAAVDTENMSENDQMMLGLGVMGVIGNALPKLQADVPGLAPYIDMLMQGMMTE